jgi:hypothetical protein
MPKQQEEPLKMRAHTFHPFPSTSKSFSHLTVMISKQTRHMKRDTYNLDSSYLHFILDGALAIFCTVNLSESELHKNNIYKSMSSFSEMSKYSQ